MTRVTWEGDKELMDYLRRIKAEVLLDFGMGAGADLLIAELMVYPPKPRKGRKQKPKTERQRRFLMWAISTGRIRVPYKRTRKLKRGWKKRKIGRFEWGVYNEVPYAKWVQSDRSQSRFHTKTGWSTGALVWRKHERRIRDRIKMTISNEMEALV